MEQDGLSTVAEVAVGLAGFSGIALALTSNPPHYFLARVLSILAIAIITIFLALMPTALASAGWRPETMWRIGSGLLAAGIAAVGFLVTRARRRSLPEEHIPLLYYFINVMVGANLICQVLNCGLVWSGSFAIFYSGLVSNLVYCATLFLGLVVFRPGSDAEL